MDFLGGFCGKVQKRFLDRHRIENLITSLKHVYMLLNFHLNVLKYVTLVCILWSIQLFRENFVECSLVKWDLFLSSYDIILSTALLKINLLICL